MGVCVSFCVGVLILGWCVFCVCVVVLWVCLDVVVGAVWVVRLGWRFFQFDLLFLCWCAMVFGGS